MVVYSIGNTTNKVTSILRENNSGYSYFKTMTADTKFSYTGELLLVLRIPNGTTIDEKIYPMISIEGGDFEKYQENVIDIELQVISLGK